MSWDLADFDPEPPAHLTREVRRKVKQKEASGFFKDFRRRPRTQRVPDRRGTTNRGK